jgi:hypothetical protein
MKERMGEPEEIAKTVPFTISVKKDLPYIIAVL